MKRRLVVIGNGMAGARFVEEVVTKGGGDSFDITVFGEEPCGNYNRILLSGVLAGTHRLDDIVINPLSWYEANHVRLHAGVRAERIDRDAGVVHGTGRVVEPFDTLVIATGSRPFLPPIDGLIDADGALVDGAFVFRTLDDCERMLARTCAARTAVVIGGGLLGLEAARGLLNHGLDVTLVQLSGRLMNAQLDDPAGRILRRQFERMGLRILTGQSTVGVIHDGEVRGVRFADGSTAPCDMLVVTAGVRANVELAAACGLEVRRGIVVGDDLACLGAENIYALGECVEHRGSTFGLVAPLWEQASVLSDRLTRRRIDASYEGSLLTTKLKVAGLDVAVMGEPEQAGEDDEVVSYVEASRGIYKKLLIRNDRLVGAILIGDGPIVPSIAHVFTSGGALPVRRADLLFPLLEDTPRRAVEELQDDAQICDCNGVSKAEILACVLRGASSLQIVCERTRAGSGCGSCRPEVQRLLDMAWKNMDTPSEGSAGDTAAAPTAVSAESSREPANGTGDETGGDAERGWSDDLASAAILMSSGGRGVSR